MLTLREILCYRYVFFLERPDIQFFLSKTGHDTITNITHTHITRFLRRAEFRAEFRLCSSDMGIPKTMAFSFLSHGLMTRMMAGGTPILGNSYIYILNIYNVLTFAMGLKMLRFPNCMRTMSWLPFHRIDTFLKFFWTF